MPKDDINYSNTIIYKIYCKNSKITDVYVGHTTNFIKRKYQHKNSCNNIKNNTKNNIKIYDIIRENGGWENWDMIEIAKYNCKESTQARIKEQEHYEELKSSLNTSKPFVKKSKYSCKLCNVIYYDYEEYDKHLICKSHIKNNEELLKSTNQHICQPNSEPDNNIFYCNICDYKCYKKQHLKQHLLSQSHKNREINNVDKSVNGLGKQFNCNCGKHFKDRSGLWRHKQKCILNQENTDENIDEIKADLTDSNVILHILKQNDEFKQLIFEQNKTILEQNSKLIEICKQGTSNTNISNVNSHNKTFNLNVFLNETCKDAMNITDFVDSLNLQLSDLENVGRLGYVEGISKIIIKSLQALDVHKRPVHCSDSKREVIYIKDEDKWEKENEHKNKLRKVIKKVANKNSRLLPEFKAKHPDCVKASSKFSDQYNKIIVESFDTDQEKEDKIIKKIAKEVIINKDAD